MNVEEILSNLIAFPAETPVGNEETWEGSLYRGLLGISTIVVGTGSVEECRVVNKSVDLHQLIGQNSRNKD